MKHSKDLVKRLVKETLEQKYTKASASWGDLIDELSKEIKKPIVLDDAGNYNVCECEPYHISIRPIVHGICDVQAFKDYSDRTKKLFRTFDEVKKFVKDYLDSKELNYVDSALQKSVDNAKDKQGGTSADKEEDMEHMVDFKDNYKPIKNQWPSTSKVNLSDFGARKTLLLRMEYSLKRRTSSLRLIITH